MSHANMPKIVDKIDPYNSLALRRQRRGSESSSRSRTKSLPEL